LDGASGEPCITHRGTLVASIFLRDALQAIKSYAFRYSPYPLILTIENHCSLQQQEAMARAFVEVNTFQILGDDIYMIPENEPLTELPSPSQLKHKYLLRGKRVLAAVTGVDEGREDDDEASAAPENKYVHPDLSKLISLSQVKLTRCLRGDIDKHGVNESASLSETKVKKLGEESEALLAAYTSKHFVKSYPKGLRQDSSNFCPMQSWIAGVQSVALNMQTYDENMDLSAGLFRINGNCGYVLKPPVLIRGLGKQPQSRDLITR
uniref:Phosphoinositide phospholipase C n=1 Tax=Gongylonema pulchrum TaxID=637853 RepID=A0A183ENN0_9BILA